MQSCFASIKIMQTCFFFAGRRCQRNVDPLRQRQMQQALQGLQGLQDDPRSLWRHQGEQWSRSHDELNQFRWSRWSNPWTRWTISPHGMKLVKVCEISQVVRFYCLTFWTSIMWTLIFIPFRDSTSLRHLEVCVFVVFLKSFLAFLVFYSVFCDVIMLRKSISAIKPGAEMLKDKRWEAFEGTSRLNCVAPSDFLRHPSASFGPLWPVWSFVIFLGFCGGKAESWQSKASLFTMSKDAESQIYRFHSSVFDEFHDFHGHQGSDRSDLPNMKSWPLETPAAFGNTQEGSTDRSTSKKCSSTHCRNFLRIWMWWSLIALPCIFKKCHLQWCPDGAPMSPRAPDDRETRRCAYAWTLVFSPHKDFLCFCCLLRFLQAATWYAWSPTWSCWVPSKALLIRRTTTTRLLATWKYSSMVSGWQLL